MTFTLSPQSIDALAEVISGGSANDTKEPVGIYRSGPKIEKFMRSCNVSFQVTGSRLPSLVDRLISITHEDGSSATFTRLLEAAADPRDFIHDAKKHSEVIAYLNQALLFDGLELKIQGTSVRLTEAGKSVPVLSELAGLSNTIDFDTVERDLERALDSVQTDPEDAVTSACSTLESVCRSILVELALELPAKKDVQGLYNAVKEPLGLSAGRTDIDPLIANDVRQILSGISSMINGIGALRTHGGDAHGREKGYRRIDERIARLSIHSASTIALFLLETWQQKYPMRTLSDTKPDVSGKGSDH